MKGKQMKRGSDEEVTHRIKTKKQTNKKEQ